MSEFLSTIAELVGAALVIAGLAFSPAPWLAAVVAGVAIAVAAYVLSPSPEEKPEIR